MIAAALTAPWLTGIDNETLFAGAVIVAFGLPWIGMWRIVAGERAERAQRESDQRAEIDEQLRKAAHYVDLLERLTPPADAEAFERELDEARRHAADGVADDDPDTAEPQRGIA